MKTFEVVVEGNTPLLMHRFSESAEVDAGKGTRRVHIADKDPRAEAEKGCYRDAAGALWFPSSAIARLLREAGGAHKQRGSRKTLKYIIPAATRMADEAILLFETDRKTRLKDFEVDGRSVVIPATKGRVMRYRARLEKWVGKLVLVVNEDLIAPETIQQLLTEGGQQIGLGDFRPERGGPFGTFQVVLWSELKMKKVA